MRSSSCCFPQVRNDQAKSKPSGLGFVARDNNGVRAFMLLETIVDIVIGALSLSNEVLVGVASGAIVLAVAAIGVLLVVPWRFRHSERVSSTTYQLLSF